MNDLDAARLICVILQKLETGREKQKKLTDQKNTVAAENPWYETRDCPVQPDTELIPEPMFPIPVCPFSKTYINTRYFQKKLAAYQRKIFMGPFRETFYEDQIRYIRYLNQKKTVESRNFAIQKRNEEKDRRRIINEQNKAVHAWRFQEAQKKKNETLAWYFSKISTFDNGVKAAEAMLNSLYKQYHVYEKVQNLYAMSHIYTYLDTGQCYPLTIGRATDKYMEREFQNALLGKIDTVLQKISENAANQAALQRSVSEMKQGNQQILSQLENLNTMSENMGSMLSDMSGTLININKMKLGVES